MEIEDLDLFITVLVWTLIKQRMCIITQSARTVGQQRELLGYGGCDADK